MTSQTATTNQRSLGLLKEILPERVDVVVIDSDFRHRKMIVGFAKKLGKSCCDVTNIDELKNRNIDWNHVGTVFFHVTDKGQSLSHIAHQIRSYHCDTCIYFAISDTFPVDDVAMHMPSGTLFYSLPVKLNSFNVALKNCAMIKNRNHGYRVERLRRLSDLVEMEEQLFSNSKAMVTGDLGGYFQFTYATLNRELHIDGLVILSRRDHSMFWKVEFSKNTPSLIVGNKIRDAGDLEVLAAGGEPLAVPAKQADPLTPSLRVLAQHQLLFVPEQIPLHNLDYLWIAFRKCDRKVFRTWEIEKTKEISLLTRLSMDGAITTTALIHRFIAFLSISHDTKDLQDKIAILKAWAQDIARAADGEGFILSVSKEQGDHLISSYPVSRIDDRTIDELTANARFLSPGIVEDVEFVDESGLIRRGLLMLLTEQMTWLFVQLKTSPSRLETLILSQALPSLVAATRQYIQQSSEVT